MNETEIKKLQTEITELIQSKQDTLNPQDVVHGITAIFCEYLEVFTFLAFDNELDRVRFIDGLLTSCKQDIIRNLGELDATFK